MLLSLFVRDSKAISVGDDGNWLKILIQIEVTEITWFGYVIRLLAIHGVFTASLSRDKHIVTFN